MSKFTSVKESIENVLNELKSKNNTESEMLTSLTNMREFADFLQQETNKIKDHANAETKKIQENIEAINKEIAAAAKKAEEEFQARMRENEEKLAKLMGVPLPAQPIKPGKEEVPDKPEKTKKLTFAEVAETVIESTNWADEDPEDEEKPKPKFEIVGKKQPPTKVTQILRNPNSSKKFVEKTVPNSNIKMPVISIEHETDAANFVGQLCYCDRVKRFVICIEIGNTKVFTKLMPAPLYIDGKPYKVVEHRPVEEYPDPDKTSFYVPVPEDIRCFHNSMKFWPASQANPPNACVYRLGSITTFKEDLSVIEEVDMRLYNDFAAHHFMLALMAAYFKL
jgi:hypothetical protein